MRTLPLTYKTKQATKGLHGNVYKFPKKDAVLNQFGFNGQLKDNEIYGEGNAYTAEYWEYDPRSIRRWNRDPVVKPWESPYAAFGNNPILLADPNGDDAEKRAKRYEKKLTDRGDGATSRKLEDGTFEVTTVKSIKNKEEGTTDYVFSTKTFKDNWLDRTGKKIVKGLQSADGWLNSKKGNSYGEGEDWVKSIGIRPRVSGEWGSYIFTLEAGLGSTHEDNAFGYFNANLLVGKDNQTSYLPSLSGGIGIGMSPYNDFTTDKQGLTTDVIAQIQTTASALGLPLAITHTQKISIVTGQRSYKTEAELTFPASKPGVRAGVYWEGNYMRGGKPFNISGG